MTQSQNTVLLFGPQALSFEQGSFNQIRSTLLSSPQYKWILDILAELPALFTTAAEKLPKLKSTSGERLLHDLNDWFHSGTINESSFQLPNILLSPLVVITHLIEYSQYQQSLLGSDNGHKETIGFCTGLLSALAVSSSADQVQFEQYGAVAVRLAMIIGAVVDTEDAVGNFGESKSLVTAWNTSESKGELMRIVDGVPDVSIHYNLSVYVFVLIIKAYVAVGYDENRATVTTSTSGISTLQQRLRAANIIATQVDLQGRFHSNCYEKEVDALDKLCDSRPGLQFPPVPSLVLPTWFGGGEGRLHHRVLRSILLEHSEWFQLFSTLHSSKLSNTTDTVVSFGPERCIPPSILRRLPAKVIHFADVNPFSRQSDNDIAVVGMACNVAGASDIEEFWNLLCEGKSQHQPVPPERFGFETVFRDVDTKRTWYGNFIKDHDVFDHKFFKKSPREISSTDPQQRLMLQIAYQAVQQSGYFRPANPNRKVGCYVGVCAADYENNVACHAPNAFSATGNLKSFIAGKISHYFGWTGPGLTIDTACSSSAVAVHQACRAILAGDCESALAGGTNVMAHPIWFQNLAAASFLSPTGQCKPFDTKADGYCRGEGVAAVFLKKMSAAIADGDMILGTISSTAVYQNQNCTPIFVPNAPSLSDLFRDVTRLSGLSPGQITVVEAHGTGTPVGDPAEYDSIRQVLGGPVRSKPLHLGSVKGLIGHTECTSGVMSLIKVLLMIQEGYIPPQASFSSLNPGIKATSTDQMQIPTKLLPWEDKFRAALINNYGASGSNASMVVTQSPARSNIKTASSGNDGVRLPIWIAGLDDRSLRAYAARLRQFLSGYTVSPKRRSLANLAFNLSCQSNRGLDRALMFSCQSVEELEQRLRSFAVEESSLTSIPRPNQRPVILCFGGQVSTFVGLDKQFYESVAILRKYLDEVDRVCRSIHVESIYPGIFQRTPFPDPVQLQTKLFAVQYASARCWIDCGVQPVAVVGHSFGELTALCVSRVLTVEDAVRIIAGRARIIRDSWGAEKGAMMAVEADQPDVERLLAESHKSCPDERAATIACFNGPRSLTLAGSTKAIDVVQETSRTSFASMKSKRLNVTNAFHSTLVEPLMDELEQSSRGVTFHEPKIPLAMACENQSTEVKLSARYVAEHMRYPVYFNHVIQRLNQQYPTALYLEAGSNSTITTMAGRALGMPSSAHFQAVNFTSENGSMQNLTDTTVSLWKAGSPATFWTHHALQSPDYAPVILPPYQFDKVKHWLDLKAPPKAAHEQPVSLPQAQEELPKGLLTFVGYQDGGKQRSAKWRINTMIPNYEEMVSGHTIAQTAPICPATLEVDIAVEALRGLRPDFATAHFQPRIQNVDNQAPLCVDPSRSVCLEADAQDKECYAWNWKIVSTGSGKNATTVHVTGQILFNATEDPQFQSEFGRYERLIGHQRCSRLLNSTDADDIIQGRNIYKTFAEIVDYGEMYRGLQKLVGKNDESAGRVVKKPSGETWLDTHLSDCFSQVGGIWVNCMTDRDLQTMYIANGFEQWIRSPKVNGDSPSSEVWDVFACHHRPSDKTFTTDIFVFNAATRVLTEVILGINYAQVPKISMSRLLTRLSPGLSAATTAPASGPALTKTQAPVVSTPAQAKPTTAPRPKKERKTTARPDITGRIKAVLADLAGLEIADIKDDAELADLGIDSLMGMELAKEIESAFQCTIPVDDLAHVTDFPGLLKCLQSIVGEADELEEKDEEEESSGVDEPSDSLEFNTPATSVASVPKVDIVTYLAEFLGLGEGEVTPGALLRDLGVDSLLSTELRSDIEGQFEIHLPHDEMIEELSIEQLDAAINGRSGNASPPVKEEKLVAPVAPINTPVPRSNGSSNDLVLPVHTILEVFGETKQLTDKFIEDYRCADYMDTVNPKQTQLCVALTVEAFEQMGCPLKSATPGQKLDRIQCLPQHQRLADYLYEMLENEARLIDIEGDQITRTAIGIPTKSSETILQDLRRQYPDHDFANRLTYFTGMRLKDVLTGNMDGIKLIFGSEEGRELVSGLYGDSLLNKLSYKQMEDFFSRLASKLPPSQGPLKILEMGAGTGGTTKWIVPLLAKLNVPVEYTFTDLSPSFVAMARKKFKAYPFMAFRAHDIEKPPADDLVGTQHVVLASNAVHATHSLTESTKNIRRFLRPDGFLMMLEMTQTVYWIDMIFGLLEGWWLFDDGRRHAISHESRWERDLHSVGFGHVDWTDGHRPEVKLQKIFIALASGSRYELLPIAPRPEKESLSTDVLARSAAVDEYVRKHTSGFAAPESKQTDNTDTSGHCVLLTGATGSLGSHLAANLASLPTVERVVCLNRRSGSTDAKQRQHSAFASRGIYIDERTLEKLQVVEVDNAKPLLGLLREEYDNLSRTATHILHNAWPMSGKRPLKGFELQFQVMRNLITLAAEASSHRPAGSQVTFQLISSIATVGHYPLQTGQVLVPEERMMIDSVLPNGYGDAKYVCERMLDETLHKYDDRFRAMAVRLGQIAGSSVSGYWNHMEHLSFMIKSSQTLKALPDFDGDLCWTPVDQVAGTLSDLLLGDATPNHPIYHIDNPVRQPWKEMIPILADALEIPRANIIPFSEWVRRVRQFPGNVEWDNPAAKLIEFLDDNFLRMSCGGLLLDTAKSREHSKALAAVGPVSGDVARKYIRYWKEIGFLF